MAVGSRVGTASSTLMQPPFNHSSWTFVELSPKQVTVPQTTTWHYIGHQSCGCATSRIIPFACVSTSRHVRSTRHAWNDRTCACLHTKEEIGPCFVRWRFSMTSQCKRSLKNKRVTISLWFGLQHSGVSTWRST